MKPEKRGRKNFRPEYMPGWQSLCCFILLLCWFCCAPADVTGAEPPGIKEQFEAKISQLAGLPVSVKNYSLEYATVHLDGVKIGDLARPELPYINIKKLSATCDFMSLLGGNLVLKEIIINSLTGNLTQNAAGNFLPTGFKRSASSTGNISSADLPFNLVKGKNLEISVFDAAKKQIMKIKIASATLSDDDAADQKSKLLLSASLSGAVIDQRMLTRPIE
ncbi:MAG: hypothetical protein PHD82_09935, partial [Candidatus Riflebacteria bacterium]|nr:hypothetical protein [Candidatus Riflebacteria bacterium]